MNVSRWILAVVALFLGLASPHASGQLAMAGRGGQVTIYVELEGDPVGALAPENGARSGVALAGLAPRARARAARLAEQHATLQNSLQGLGARVTGRFTRVANALRVRVPEAEVEAISKLPGVRRVQRTRLYTRHLGVSVPFVGAPAVWSSAAAGVDGKGIRIGIIDSGIDYTHADFGGSGDVADFRANDPTRIEPGSFPTAKVVGGFDFAGDAYNPGSDANETPIPDEDPLDCAANGHGTHVAGIAAGYGVLADGQTFQGAYTNGMDFGQFAVGPGVAPRASLYALKVFGCEGSTSLVTDALEWAADPNGDYDFSDRLDVVNLSLGGDFGSLDPEDTDIGAANRLAELGCVVVCSAGNDDNIFFAVGAPGVANRAISVANSVSKGLGKAITVESPASVAGRYFMVEGAITPALTNAGPVTGKLVYVEPNLGCEAPRNADALRGNVALIDRGTCFFSEKILHAQDAGALAVVMVNNVDTSPIPMGGDGEGIRIPGVMISKADGALLKARLGETVRVRLDGEATVNRSAFVDTLDDSSSRGPGSPSSSLKPEISAPGANIFSAKAGSGREGISQSGTSMASPAVAGAAALMRQLHRDWPVEEIKAALMNTAKPIANADGVPYPETRMGSGRMQLPEAGRAQVTASAETDDGSVGVTFGSLVVAGPYEAVRTVRLVNHGDRAATFRVAFSNSVAQAGVIFQPVTDTVTVPAGGTASAAVRLMAKPEEFELTPDRTTSAEIGGGTLLPRHFLYEASGQLWFQGDSGSLHVPCYANLRAASDFRSQLTRIVLPARDSTKVTPEVTLRFTGRPGPTNQFPLVSVFQLGDTSPDKHLTTPSRAAADLLAVGAATDVASAPSFDDASVYFGIATSGSWTTPQPVISEFNVMIDVNQDGFEDYAIYNGNASSTNTSGSRDTFMSVVLELGPDLRIYSTNAVAYLNYYAADELETAVFNNSVMILPVPVWAIGLRDRASAFRYKVYSYAPSGSVDRTGWIPFDAAHPVIDTAYASLDGTPIHDDGLPIQVRLDRERARDAGQRLPGVLLLHHFSPPEGRVEIVTLDLARDDTDNDSLPDWWEQRHFGGVAAAGRDGDFDGDGSPNFHELTSGTDPKDPSSVFRMRSASRVSPKNIAVRWSGIAGQTYVLERSTNLVNGFTEIVRDDIESTPPLNSITDTNASGAGPFFYRVRLKP